jgi:anaerobic ribonucleoside-triphosphate reductase activating protein
MKPFNCITPSIVFQEVPNEISLCFSITGCTLGCKGCHSTELWQAEHGIPLTNQSYLQWLKKYQGLISCVLFFGGEWHKSALIDKLLIANNLGLKTCLYSGANYVDMSISQHLTFLKTGAWRAELGGLDSPITNQRFIDAQSGAQLNHLFSKQPLSITHANNQGAHHVAA